MKNELMLVDNKAIGYRIREEREKLKLTREKFAEIVDFSPLYIGQLERGERQMSLTALVKISKYLHISIDYLIYGDNLQKPNSIFLKEHSKSYSVKNIDGKLANKETIYNLIDRCSSKELNLIEDIITLIIPYIK